MFEWLLKKLGFIPEYEESNGVEVYNPVRTRDEVEAEDSNDNDKREVCKGE